MSELECAGKIKRMKILKQMIEGKDVVPASQLAKNKAAAEAEEKSFEEAARAEELHRKTKISAREHGGILDSRVVRIRLIKFFRLMKELGRFLALKCLKD
jgi:hypothetical protein